MSFVKGSLVVQERQPTGKLRIQKLVDGVWKTTAFAGDIEAVKRHAEAVGGCVRALDKSGAQVYGFEEVAR